MIKVFNCFLVRCFFRFKVFVILLIEILCMEIFFNFVCLFLILLKIDLKKVLFLILFLNWIMFLM